MEVSNMTMLARAWHGHLRPVFAAALVLVSIAILACSTARAAETITFFHNDMAGSPVLASDVNGNIVWRETYRPYGDRVIQSSQSTGNTLWFGGKAYDRDTGLSYMGARYYDPLLGRFMGADPAPFDPKNLHSLNRYAYANNNPYRFVDPDGHSPIDVVFLAYDIGKLGVAIYNGDGVGSAAIDVATSLVGVVSPVPGTGQAIKAVRAVDKAVEAARIADHAADTARSAEAVAQASSFARKGGESAAAAVGRRAHNNYGTALGSRYDTKVTLPSGKKPDAVNWEAREVRELKPDNARAMSRGQKQVEEYRKELEQVTSEKWTSVVDVYRSEPRK